MNFDFLAGLITVFTWWGIHSLYKRAFWHEVWVDRYELKRLYDKADELKRMDWKEFNPVVQVKYDCKFCIPEESEDK
jgi:hypothetical protein